MNQIYAIKASGLSLLKTFTTENSKEIFWNILTYYSEHVYIQTQPFVRYSSKIICKKDVCDILIDLRKRHILLNDGNILEKRDVEFYLWNQDGEHKIDQRNASISLYRAIQMLNEIK